MRRRELIKAGLAAVTYVSMPSIVKASGSRLLRFAPQADLTVLDPAFPAYVTRHHALMVFDTLYGLDDNFNPVPQMLEAAVTEMDGRLWRFTLRKGLRFHDGEPVRGKDCVASIRRWAASDSLGPTFRSFVEEMAAETDREFTIRLIKPFPQLPAVFAKLSSPMLVIMPERLAQVAATTRITEMVGSGPFRFRPDERVPGARNVYERFDDYRPRESGTPSWTSGPKIAHFDRVEWLTMPDVATAASSLQQGSLDWWEYASSDLVPLLRKSKDIQVELTGSLGFMSTLVLNPLHGPMSKAAFRRVLLSAANQADMMTAIAGTEPGMWRDGTGVYTPNTTYASKSGTDAGTGSSDVAGMKRALADSGYNGEKIVLLGANDLPVINAMSDVTNDALRKIGVNIDYQMMDWGSLLARRVKRDAPDHGGWSIMPIAVDGIEQVTPLTHRFVRALGPTAATSWLESEEIENIWAAFVSEADTNKRKELAERLQVQVLKEVPAIPSGQYMQNTAFRRNLTGRLDGASIFWNIRRSS
jgi:peptide/nickel transport system substrate-binding protein